MQIIPHLPKEVLSSTSVADFREKVLDSEEPAIVDCFAEWCGPCKAIAPRVEKWSEEYTQIKFYVFDVDKVPDLSAELGVRAMPTFMLFKGGEKITEVVGASVSAIEQGLQSLL
jgi:thioredoxin 1